MSNSIVDFGSTASSPTFTPGAPFAVLGLRLPLVRALVEEGYELPTPVQGQAIPSVLDGRDLLACAQTGTGKTAAFVLPVLQKLAAEPRSPRGGARALVLSPTRELAAQIGERTAAYGRHLGARHAVIYGGVSQRNQEIALERGVDLVIATPGRLLDLLEQRVLSLESVRTLVLDEADRMLDMGFLPDVRRILARMPRREQMLFFSATMPDEIRRLASEILRDPVTIAVTPDVTAAASVTHSVWHVPQVEKRAVVERLVRDAGDKRVIVFTRTKHGANRLATQLERAAFSAGVIHGNKSQSARERVLGAFRRGETRVLVATDLAARGIDVDDVALVINFDLPNVAESYVHRIGRTGRAGNEGTAVSLCDPSERLLLGDIERLLRFRIPVVGADGVVTAPPAVVERSARALAPGESAHRRRHFRGSRRR
jgi:ATP-dependent RNA helicase RhlE